MTEADLVRRMADGDAAAFEAFYDVVSGPVYQMAFAILGEPSDAEDISQEVLLQLWRDARRYDPRRGRVLGWALAAARSRALDRARSNGARRRLVDRLSDLARPEDDEERIVPGPAPDAVRLALQSLPPEQRQVVEMAYFAGMSQTEMSAELGVPLGTIKTRVKLAMDKLRAALPHE